MPGLVPNHIPHLVPNHVPIFGFLKSQTRDPNLHERKRESATDMHIYIYAYMLHIREKISELRVHRPTEKRQTTVEAPQVTTVPSARSAAKAPVPASTFAKPTKTRLFNNAGKEFWVWW